jgi:hypothetical protein
MVTFPFIPQDKGNQKAKAKVPFLMVMMVTMVTSGQKGTKVDKRKQKAKETIYDGIISNGRCSNHQI